MAYTPHLLVALLALTPALAQDLQTQTTWAAVVFTFHGEQIPSLHDGPYNLTPLGANQLLNAGQVIRDRYISAPVNGSEITIAMPINGLSSDEIDNSQMEVLSTNDEYISGSALAFMQGLYPPRNTIVLDEESELGNGTLEQFPLNGYQYPNIETLSTVDYNYIWLAGNVGCTNYSINEVNTIEAQGFTSDMVATADFYQSLADSVFWDFDPSIINLANAYPLYEYALFEYNHNRSVYDTLSLANLTQLQNLASLQQWDFNTPTGGNTVNAIAGQTLATKVFTQFSHNIASDGVSDKLTVMFGSFEPFLSFFSLSGLSTGPSASAFTSLPEYGSMMAFELFSYTPRHTGMNLSTPFPSTDDLWVRFIFRNGTNESDPMIAYPLFNRGNSEVDMTWSEFAQGISGFAISEVSDWCTSCNAVNLFCEAIESNLSNSTSQHLTQSFSSKNLSPAIAGVIGATVTLGLFIIGSLALCLLGFRIEHRERNPSAQTRDLGVLERSRSGGFKGAEKLASDTDLTLKTGAGASVIRHERVGSWELNESPTSGGRHSSLDKEIESGRAVSNADYSRNSEDGIGPCNPFGDPVKPVDHV
ncbi:hypothetical protein G7Y89_g5097 [Cudoniella acicularis]|uniref:Phosphoglycerate mutase-like protein n=1 Tax=Cudoniella acicularis TaxID=354080 RepID=A0A8H4RR92_9HELO|nr:hypothetical protein G7Y89_g5097 [Cudoniella acicularis]